MEAKLGIGDQRRLFASDRIVYASAPWYGFLLHRKNSTEQGWTLASFLTPDELNNPKLQDIVQHPLKTMSQCFQPLSASGLGGPQLAKVPEYMTINIQKVEPDEGSLLIVTYSAGSKDSPAAPPAQVRMVVDKAASYCPIEVVQKNPSQPDILVEEKRTLISKNPIRCGSYTYRVTIGKKVFNELNITFSDYSDQPPPDDELKLSYYGLPEPSGIEPPPRKTPNYIWLLIAAVAFALIAATFVYLSRRRRPAA